MDDQLKVVNEFPPPGYVAVKSAVDGIEVYKLVDKTDIAGPAVIDFKCPQCFATTAYSVPDGGLRCTHCGYYEAPSQPVVGKAAEEFEFTLETMTAAGLAQGWGTPERIEMPKLPGENFFTAGSPDAYLPVLRIDASLAAGCCTGYAAPQVSDSF